MNHYTYDTEILHCTKGTKGAKGHIPVVFFVVTNCSFLRIIEEEKFIFMSVLYRLRLKININHLKMIQNLDAGTTVIYCVGGDSQFI